MAKADYLKFFMGDSSVMVALFTLDHEWIANLPVKSVFDHDVASEVPFEEIHPISKFKSIQFNPEFAASYTNLTFNPQNTNTLPKGVLIEQIVSNTSRDLNLPPDQMQRFTKEIFSRMRVHLSAGLSLRSSYVTVTSTGTNVSTNWTISFPQQKNT